MGSEGELILVHAQDAGGAGVLERGLVLGADRHGPHRRRPPRLHAAGRRAGENAAMARGRREGGRGTRGERPRRVSGSGSPAAG